MARNENWKYYMTGRKEKTGTHKMDSGQTIKRFYIHFPSRKKFLSFCSVPECSG